MLNNKKSIILYVFGLIFFSGQLFSATFKIGLNSVNIKPGQTIEIPLFSSQPITSDLTARGKFQPGDVSFTPGPKCHLSSHDCTLIITASPNSQNYTAVPVVVSESGSRNKPVFILSVIPEGQPKPLHPKLPKIISKPLIMSDEIGNEVNLTINNTTSSILKNLTAIELPHGVHSSICPRLESHMSCSLKISSNDRVEPGDYIISIDSDQGILQHHILSITTAKKIITPHPTFQRSNHPLTASSGNLSAAIQPHSISSTYYTTSSNGPVYQMIQITNNGATSVTLDTPVISGTDASFFSIDNNTSHYQGTPNFCYNAPTLATGESCEIIIQSQLLGDPAAAPATATLQISDGISADTLTFTLIDTTYIYAGGGFNTLGNASVSGGNLLAQCTAGTCSNALQGYSSNYAYINSSVGQWINAITVTPTGNLIIGGVFGGIGGATSGASSGSAALLAQCIPGSSIDITSNACFNQINTGSTINPYILNYAYIDSIALLNNASIILGGDFNQIRSVSTSTGKLLARCLYSGVTANQACSNFFSVATTKYANNSITALSIIGSSSVYTGGLFTQIAGYPSSSPGTGTTFAMCTNSSCSQGMGSSNPNNSILGMTNDGTNLYMGGTFTSIGGYTDISGGYPLVQCTPGTLTTCTNALANSDDANGYIEGLVYYGGTLYVGGQFTTIGGATPVSSGNMLASCSIGGGCSNLITDLNPYATGSNWQGGIFALAIGNQTSIIPN